MVTIDQTSGSLPDTDPRSSFLPVVRRDGEIQDCGWRELDWIRGMGTRATQFATIGSGQAGRRRGARWRFIFAVSWLATGSSGAMLGAPAPRPAAGRVYRGGSWICPPEVLRSASRHGPAPILGAYIGFRVALAPPVP